MCEFFYYLNNGMPLNAITSTRAKAKSRKEITELGTHKLFKNALTAKAFERYTNEDIVVKSYAMLHMEEPSMETKVIRPLMAEWFVEFFSGKKSATISSTYNTYAGSGSARKEASVLT